jgi:hypothetical protein
VGGEVADEVGHGLASLPDPGAVQLGEVVEVLADEDRLERELGGLLVDRDVRAGSGRAGGRVDLDVDVRVDVAGTRS